jgi:hypothetical protein
VEQLMVPYILYESIESSGKHEMIPDLLYEAFDNF